MKKKKWGVLEQRYTFAKKLRRMISSELKG